MKKCILIVSLIASITIAFVGCEMNKTNHEKDGSDVAKTNEITKFKENMASKPDKTNDAIDQSMKQKYQNKLDTIQKQVVAEKIKVDKEGNTDRGVSTYAKNNYDQWDTALNEIYKIIKQSLSAQDMKMLQTEEIKWISQKEKAAKDAESEHGQGSQLGYVAYYSTSAKLTKDRCYELVEKYLK